LVKLPSGFEREQLGSLQFHGHVRQLEGHALELADLLAELDAVNSPLLGMLERALGATEADVKVSVWDGFSKADATSALDCARWVIHQTQAKVFWPPAERVDYDDYAVLSLGRSLEETVGMGGAA
jgi:hypothetical protein